MTTKTTTNQAKTCDFVGRNIEQVDWEAGGDIACGRQRVTSQ